MDEATKMAQKIAQPERLRRAILRKISEHELQNRSFPLIEKGISQIAEHRTVADHANRTMKNIQVALKRPNLSTVGKDNLKHEVSVVRSVKGDVNRIITELKNASADLEEGYRYGGKGPASKWLQIRKAIGAIAERRGDLLRRLKVVTGEFPKLMKGALIPPLSLMGLPSDLEELQEFKKKGKDAWNRKHMT